MNVHTKESLLSPLIANRDTLEALRAEINGNLGASIPQPVMVIGQGGSGKTTLLRRLYQSVSHAGTSRHWIDGRSVFSTDDITAHIKGAASSAILFLDDMDFYLTRCSYSEQFRLRRVLYNEGAPMLIASSSRVVPALAEYEAPFFEGLKTLYLAPLSAPDLAPLLDDADLTRALRLLELLPPTIQSAEIVCHIIRANDSPESDRDILLSFFSETYRNTYQSLPPNSQHILNAFEPGDGGLTMPEIRAQTGLPTHLLTPYLLSLKTAGFLSVDKSVKRNTRYSISDPLFQAWLSPSSPSPKGKP